MEKHTADRRVRYSHKVIRESFIELLQTTPINKITVKDICARADVNRGTFYAYYQDPYDLMEKIEDELVGQVMRALDQGERGGGAERTSVTYQVVLELMEFIRQNAELCRVLLSGKVSSSFITRVTQQAREAFTREWSGRIGNGRKEALDYLYTFSVTGSIGVIQRWLQSGMRETPAQIASIVETAVYQGISAFAGEALNE